MEGKKLYILKKNYGEKNNADLQLGEGITSKTN